MNILIVDDEPDVRKSLSNFLNKLGHHVYCAEDGMAGLREFHLQDLQMVITDLRMPGMDGLELLHRIKVVEKSPVDVILITGHGDMDNAIQALKHGAFDYLQKPINIQELAITIERSAEYAALRNNYFRLKKEFKQRVDLETQAMRGEAEQLRESYLNELGLDSLYVFSAEMRKVVELAEKYSRDRSVPLLIEGESGTGKELIARYTHHFGQQNSLMPFMAVNCGALSPQLIEAELFGHEPGAFTGASRSGKIGKLEAASGGTIFFDEIAEMPLQLQVNLLRVLEDKTLHRLGGVKEIPVDIRIICATNKNLHHAVEKKEFRLDLYYRINMGHIQIPPLRKRRDDILPLAQRFIIRAFKRQGKRFESFSPASEKFMLDFSWPGNVRQLKNVMERLAIQKADGRIQLTDLNFVKDITMSSTGHAHEIIHARAHFTLPPDGLDLEALNQDIIKKALTMNDGNQTQTAKYLGISRRVLQGRLKKIWNDP